MNHRQKNQAQSFLRAAEFSETLLPDFTHEPPTPVDLKFAAARVRLAAAIADLGGKQAIQAGGGFAEETEKQRELLEDLQEELAEIRDAADSIAAETQNPSLMERFRMPAGNGRNEITTKARAFAAAIRELGLNDELEALGHSADAATGLEAMAKAVDLSEGGQGAALSERAGATASIPDGIRAGTAAIKTLNAIIGRTFKNDPATLAAWDTASHVQRSPRRRDGDEAENTQPPTP